MFQKDYTTSIRELEKALINYKMRQGIESSCHTKCEYADVRATKLDDEGLELNWGTFEDSETLHFIRQLERATCLKDCIAGLLFCKSYFFCLLFLNYLIYFNYFFISRFRVICLEHPFSRILKTF